MWRQNPFRQCLPLAGSARQEALPHARRRTGIRRAKGKPSARKHGLLTRGVVAERRRILALLGEARKLLNEVEVNGFASDGHR